MPDRAALRLERRLNDWYFACGCEQGSVAVTVTLVACITLGMFHGFDGAFAWWRVAAYVLGAALVGKTVGLAYAKVRLRVTLRRLERGGS